MDAKKLTLIWHRIYSDFIMPSRLEEYSSLLEKALKHGYRVYSIERFWAKIKANSVESGVKYLILRHDVDTDTSCARAM